MNPGIHLKVPAEQYHADPCATPSLSHSIAVDLIQRSPLHAWFSHPKLNPAFKREEKSIYDSGTVAHQCLLEGTQDKLVFVDAADWRSKDARELRDHAWEHGLTPVLIGKMEKINAMVEAAKVYVAKSQLAGIFDKGAGDPEVTMIWQEGTHSRDNSDPLGTPTLCRARPDWWTTDRSIMLDYKTGAGSAEPNGFIRQMMNMGYDVQGGFYRRGALELAGALPEYVFLVQENEPPYACSLVGMSNELHDLADRKVEFALSLWKNCLAKNQWNGYSPRVAHAIPPEYAVRSFEELIDMSQV